MKHKDNSPELDLQMFLTEKARESFRESIDGFPISELVIKLLQLGEAYPGLKWQVRGFDDGPLSIDLFFEREETDFERTHRERKLEQKDAQEQRNREIDQKLADPIALASLPEWARVDQTATNGWIQQAYRHLKGVR